MHGIMEKIKLPGSSFLLCMYMHEVELKHLFCSSVSMHKNVETIHGLSGREIFTDRITLSK